MAGSKSETVGSAGVWALARAQNGVVLHAQLAELGLSAKAIEHRAARGRLHRIRIDGHAVVGVYSVGTPDVGRRGRWMAAVLACGRGAVLSHTSAGALIGLSVREREIHVSVPAGRQHRRPYLQVHEVKLSPGDTRTFDSIPVTSPVRTLLDLACVLDEQRLEAAVNDADKLGLVAVDRMREEIELRPGQRGVRALRKLLERHEFAITDSELERRFLGLVRRAQLPMPETGVQINGFKVDFFWRELGLVVETDGLRYHRTAAQQARDRERDQAHAVAGLTTLRFTYVQVVREAKATIGKLRAVIERLARAR